MATVSDHPQGTGSGSDEEAVKAVIAATTEAFNKHDARPGLVSASQGRDSLRSGVNRCRASLRNLAIAVTFIKPDVALAHVTNEMSGVATPDGQVQPPHRELSIRVLVKDGGDWRIAAFHKTILSS